MCWYYHWGWPRPVFEVYFKSCQKLGSEGVLQFGPSHIVWSDSNLDDSSIRWCIQLCEDRGIKIYGKEIHSKDDISDEQMVLVKESLERLSEIPSEVRCCVPKGYLTGFGRIPDSNPSDFPPPDGIQMVDWSAMRDRLKGIYDESLGL